MMRLLLIFLLGLFVLGIATALIGPLIVLGIGAILAYYAYQNLVKSNNSLLNIIWWVIVGSIGISLFVGALPSLLLIAAILVVIYFVTRKPNRSSQPNVETRSNDSPVFKEYESFEAEWHDITNR